MTNTNTNTNTTAIASIKATYTAEDMAVEFYNKSLDDIHNYLMEANNIVKTMPDDSARIRSVANYLLEYCNVYSAIELGGDVYYNPANDMLVDNITDETFYFPAEAYCCIVAYKRYQNTLK